MPWLALAADRVAVEGRQLATLFGVQGIPSLVLLDLTEAEGGVQSGHSSSLHSTGGSSSSGSSSSRSITSPFTILSSEGVAQVTRDPYALQFPYRPKLSVLKSLVPRTFRNYLRNKKVQSVSTVKSAFRNILVKASPSNMLKMLLKALKNRIYALLKVLFPQFVKAKQIGPDL